MGKIRYEDIVSINKGSLCRVNMNDLYIDIPDESICNHIYGYRIIVKSRSYSCAKKNF